MLPTRHRERSEAIQQLGWRHGRLDRHGAMRLAMAAVGRSA